jgi:hypothetical protein
MALSPSNITYTNVVDGAGAQTTFSATQNLTYIKNDRVVVIQGMVAACTTNDPLAECKNLVMSVYPPGSASSRDPEAIACTYTMTAAVSTDCTVWTVSYIFNGVGGDPTVFTIQTSNFAETVETDMEYLDDGTTMVQITVNNYWQGWNKGGTKPTNPIQKKGVAYPHARVYKPRKRLLMTKTIYDPTVIGLFDSVGDQYIAHVNSAAFRGKPAGTWLCLDVDLDQQPYKGSALGTLEFVYRPEGWQPFVRWTDQFGRVPHDVWTDYATIFQSDAANQSNGVRLANCLLKADFNSLVSVLNPPTLTNPYGIGGPTASGPGF